MSHSPVLWHVTMSLDGYIAAPGGEMAWVFDYVDASDPGNDGVGERTGAVVAGRRSFDVGDRDGRDVLDGAWSGPQYLLTHRPAEVPESITIRSGDIRLVMAEARRAAAGRSVLVIGADIARQCLEAGLIDEIVVHIAPVLLGDGVRFRGAVGRSDLHLDDVGRHGGVVTLHYRTKGQS